MLISQRLERMAASYDDARRTVSRYLLEHPRAVETQSMEQVAQATFTSKATLVRVAKQLGFGGWTDFSRQYIIELERERARSTDVDHSLPFGEGASTSQIIASVADLRAAAAYETGQLQDPAEVDRAVSMVVGAGRVGLFGFGMNEAYLRNFLTRLLKIGMTATLSTSGGPYVARMLGPGDCAVMVSYTGESAERDPMCYLPALREQGVRVVGITCEGENYLRANSDAVLSVLGRERLYNKIGSFSSGESISCVLDILYAGIFARAYERNLAYRSQAARSIEGNRQPDAMGQ